MVSERFGYAVLVLIAWVALLITISNNTEPSYSPLPSCPTEDSNPDKGSCVWDNGTGDIVINHDNGTWTIIPRNER